MRITNRNGKIVLLSLFLTLACAGAASADLVARSPGLSPTNGFPLWYQDQVLASGGVRLSLCLVNNPALCQFDPVDPLNRWSRTTGFGTEAFYFQARGSIPADGGRTAAGVSADIDMRVSATYEGAVARGNQIAQNFIDILVQGLRPGSGPYLIVWPFGQRRVNADRRGEINIRVGPRILNALDFDTALGGPVGPYLKAVNPAPPRGFLGNPNILQTVTGSPTRRNFFSITAPANVDIGGTVRPNVIRTSQFRVQGRITR